MGDVEEIDFTGILKDFEKVCVADLEVLRRSKMYARFLRYMPGIWFTGILKFTGLPNIEI